MTAQQRMMVAVERGQRQRGNDFVAAGERMLDAATEERQQMSNLLQQTSN